MSLVTPPITKQPWIPPQIIILPLPDNTANKAYGSGDGDFALTGS